jgi:predicted MFS family arabinose efflux permease
VSLAQLARRHATGRLGPLLGIPRLPADDRGEVKCDPPWYSTYVLALIGLVSIANYYDRNLLTILVEPIKRDLHLSDTQMGLLSGLSFALMYSVFGIPMARLADRFGRARILGGVVAVWSVMTVLTGRTVNFTTMFFARAGVGIGEAGGLPSAHAIIADYFSPRLRGRALSVVGVCTSLGLSTALAGGGLINDWRGWRMAFYLAGVPGLVLSALVFFTVREPLAGRQNGLDGRPPAQLRSVFDTLRKRKAYVHLCAGLAIASIGSYGQLVWTPAFLMRAYHMTSGHVGSYISAVVGPASILAILLGGILSDWLASRDGRWPFWILALTFGINIPASLAFFSVHDFRLAMALTLVITVTAGLWVGPAFSVLQSLAGPCMRAMAAAIFMASVNIVGFGLGPYITGALSDALTPRFGERSLAISLCIVTTTFAFGSAHFWLATRTVIADIDEANS